MNNKITLKDIRKAINLLNANDNINTEDNIKSCRWCKHRDDANYTFVCPIHNFMQISQQQSQEIKNIFGF